MTNRLAVTRRGLIGGLVASGAAASAIGVAAGLPGTRGAVLDTVSRWNDRVQAGLFNPDRLAPTYAPSEISTPFRFNAFYPEAFAPRVDPATWRLAIEGEVQRPLALTLADLRGMPQSDQITRLICIEGWSAVGKWSGVPLRLALDAAGADVSADYVRFECADGHSTSIDMASARHLQTILALDFLDRPLPVAFGAPARLRIPVKLGFKNAKHIFRITVTTTRPGGYWEDQGYNWFAGL